jgi:outer membrane lipoprotein-sorting protein
VRLRLFAWVVVLLVLGGCRTLPPTPPPAAIASPEELLARLKSRQQHLQSFQATGRLTFLSPERNYSGTGFLKGKEPTTLRVDILDFLGRSLMSFASDGAQVQVLIPREARLYQGRATPANLAALIPPSVTLPQVLRLLVGGLPLSPGPADRWQEEAASGLYLLEWLNPQGGPKERLWVESRDLHPVKGEWYGDDGRLRFAVEMTDYGRLTAHLPGQVTLKTDTPKVELRLFYRELQVNPALSSADLLLQAPPGVARVPLGP